MDRHMHRDVGAPGSRQVAGRCRAQAHSNGMYVERSSVVAELAGEFGAELVRALRAGLVSGGNAAYGARGPSTTSASNGSCYAGPQSGLASGGALRDTFPVTALRGRGGPWRWCVDVARLPVAPYCSSAHRPDLWGVGMTCRPGALTSIERR